MLSATASLAEATVPWFSVHYLFTQRMFHEKNRLITTANPTLYRILSTTQSEYSVNTTYHISLNASAHRPSHMVSVSLGGLHEFGCVKKNIELWIQNESDGTNYPGLIQAPSSPSLLERREGRMLTKGDMGQDD